MQLKGLKDGLAKILKLCGRNGFVDIKIVEDSFLSTQYGPLGSLFRQNINREWLSSIMDNSDVYMFPIEVQLLKRESRSLKDLLRPTDSLLSDVFKNYLKILPIIGSNVPCGFAAYGTSMPLNDRIISAEVALDDSLLSLFELRHWLCVVFFCPMKKSSDWFNYWSTHRYRWWRKLSSIPSKFFMSDVIEPAIGNQEMSLMMEFPWGKEKLETITLYSNSFLKDKINIEHASEVKSASCSIVICETELNLASIAYLTNSFAEKWRNNELRNLFQFHVNLAPYKVGILLKTDESDVLKKLQDIAQHLEKDLKKCKVTIFPCSHVDSFSCNLKFTQFDEMGIPYTVVLSQKTLSSGIAGLRNRDTTLEEQIHITELTPKLLKYLQLKSFAIDENS